ncbi:MAG: DegV family EDD domain-containing protein [Gammaproteobacteria bacterium]|nr:DegV family EDD domain-containing protein [Gammaproteobacteria bacterium]
MNLPAATPQRPALLLDGQQLSAALRAGIQRLASHEEIINRINVFPVPDGDTGTNLALTLQAVLAGLRGAPEEHAGHLLTRVADAALDGARGNSGAILAQFFLGLGDRLAPCAELNAEQFAAAVRDGAVYARESLAEPREGTILTVLSDFATAVAQQVGELGVRDFATLFEATLATARRSLAATRDQLESLRRANVVDAGALGFVELLAGMGEYFATGVLPAEDLAPALLHDEEPAAGEQQDLEHRWCVECMITGEDIDRRRLREAAARLGSSLVIAGTRRKLRLHLHLNEPQQLFELAAQHGTVSSEKADDMQRQQGMAHHEARRRVAIVTDSAADLPDSILEALDIHMVPVRISFGARSFLDKIGLSPAEFFHELATNPVHPKTSQPPPGDFRRAFEFVGSHYEAVVYVGLSAKLSGTFQNAEAAAVRARTHARIVTVDSCTASLGQGLVALRAAETAAAGGSGDEVREAALAARRDTRAWGCVTTLEYALRGGRVPAWVGRIANLLHLLPLLAIGKDGGIRLSGVLPGRHDVYRRFGRHLCRRLDPAVRWRIAIAHGNAPDGARQLQQVLVTSLPGCELLPIIPLGTAFGVHGGPGCVVVAAQPIQAPA